MLVWLVVLVGGTIGLTVSTAPPGGLVVGVTITVWKVGSAGFSNDLAKNIASSHEILSDHLTSNASMSWSIEDLDRVDFLLLWFSLTIFFRQFWVHSP